MSSSKKDEELQLKIGKAPKLTLPGYDIQLSTNQAVAIAEFVDSPVYKILKNVYVHQRKDHIARTALNAAQDTAQLFLFKGAANELVTFFNNMEKIKKSLSKDDTDDKE